MLQHPKMFSNDKSIKSKHHTHTRESNCFSTHSTSSEKQCNKMFQCNTEFSEIRERKNNVYSQKLHPVTVKLKKTTDFRIIIAGS